MDAQPSELADAAEPGGPTDGEAVVAVVAPAEQRLPVVLASPHSGRRYPPDFLAASRLDPHALRKSEDGFVDELFAGGVGRGAVLVKALFPRAFVDPNREPFELDPDMFADALPSYVNSRSPRVTAGLGTIARVVAHGQEIYAGKLRFAEALARVNRYYHPYHAALRRTVERTRARFGRCLLIDCHSMPSGPSGARAGQAGGTAQRVGFVLGDCHGRACAPSLTAAADRWLTARGHVVARNAPYAGGHTTRHYGRPHARVHALQIEVGRALYMDEARLERRPTFTALAEQMSQLVEVLGRLDLAEG